MPVTMRDAFWERFYKEMKSDPSAFVLTADFGAPAFDSIRAEFPDQYCSVGIAEQNLINVAAGLALEGRRVVAYAIAPFFMRATEQVRINLAMTSQFREINVTMVGVGIGFSYIVSGPSHHVTEDVSIFRSFPNMAVVTPADANAARAAIELTRHSGVRFLRFDSQALPGIYPEDFVFPECGYAVLRNPDKAKTAFIASGVMVHNALKAAEAFPGVKVIDLMKYPADLASELAGLERIYTFEEGVANVGGLDSFVRACAPGIPVISFGMHGPYEFIARSRFELQKSCGLTVEQIIESIQNMEK